MGFLSNLFGNNEQKAAKTDDEKQKMIKLVNMSRECVGIFGDYMNSPNYPKEGNVADVNKLPVEKEALKTALKVVISTTSDEEMKENLKAAYMSLAYFQQGVGSKDIGFYASEFSNKLSAAGESDKIEIIKQMKASMDASQKWSDIALEEMQHLNAEVSAL